jgi:hypothetical protein
MSPEILAIRPIPNVLRHPVVNVLHDDYPGTLVHDDTLFWIEQRGVKSSARPDANPISTPERQL